MLAGTARVVLDTRPRTAKNRLRRRVEETSKLWHPSPVAYYMRYFMDGTAPITEKDIGDGLQKVDPAIRVEEGGDLYLGGSLLAHVEVNTPGDGLFEDELGEFLEKAEAAPRAPAQTRVVARLRATTAIVAVDVLDHRDLDETLDLMDAIWDWLESNRDGLVHAQGEGFYAGKTLILAVE
jgi:hypothetical protein